MWGSQIPKAANPAFTAQKTEVRPAGDIKDFITQMSDLTLDRRGSDPVTPVVGILQGPEKSRVEIRTSPDHPMGAEPKGLQIEILVADENRDILTHG